jgi:putative N6-adenine-specific DNA methylase
VRIEHDTCTLSVDTSGEPLHRRGHRQETGRAPLRESLAAALLLASGWEGRVPLVDPFCGAGTIAIEAALLARDRAPGRQRGFAFEAWRDFDAALWQQLRAEADARAARAPAPPPILACDRDAGAVAAAHANARRAGVEADVQILQRTLSALDVPPGPGFIVTNPPHGVRLRSGDLRDLYARFGQVLRARCPGWQVALLSADPRAHAAAGLPLEAHGTLVHGGLRLAIVTGRVPEAA